jgi:hypothetical protein
VFTSTSTMSMATVGTSAIMVRRSEFASVRSTLDSLKSTRYGSVCELLVFWSNLLEYKRTHLANSDLRPSGLDVHFIIHDESRVCRGS